MRVYECKSCGTIIGIPDDKEPLYCPMCRGQMNILEEEIELKKEINCPDCENKFFVKEDFSPYKCAFCNFTFITSPYRKSEERL